jgi:hypothetical protein
VLSPPVAKKFQEIESALSLSFHSQHIKCLNEGVDLRKLRVCKGREGRGAEDRSNQVTVKRNSKEGLYRPRGYIGQERL